MLSGSVSSAECSLSSDKLYITSILERFEGEIDDITACLPPANCPNIETESSLPTILTSPVTSTKGTKWKWRCETNYEVSSRLLSL